MTAAKACVEDFTPERLAGGRLFPDALEEDPWVLFHGTSASASAAIESKGLAYDDSVLARADIQRVNDVFKAMRWAGSDRGGFGVLNSFSAGDFATSESSPIFLTECSIRALRFATREFAGGEKLRAVRRAVWDLDRYLDDGAVRAKHASDLKREFDYLVKLGAAPTQLHACRPVDFALDWLRNEVESLQTLQRAATPPFDGFTDGVVYALRVQESDLATMTHCATMGTKAWAALPPTRIVAKMVIPGRFVYDDFIEIDHDLNFARATSGVVLRLREQAGN